MLDVGLCAYDILVLLAQPFAIELSASHPQEIDYNNCLRKYIPFLALFALISFIVKIRNKNIWLVIFI